MSRLDLVVTAIGVLLVALQFGAFERIKHVVLDATPVGQGGSGSMGQGLRALGAISPLDGILIALLLAIVLGAAILELRSSRLSTDFAIALDSRRGTLLLLAAFAFAGSRFFLAPGEFSFGDAPIHVARIHETAVSFALGERPDWTFHSYCGYPLLQFYSPLFFWVGGVLEWLIGDPHDSAKVWLFLLDWGSAFALYGWARAIGLSRLAAFVGSVGYVLTFQHTHAVLWAGALPVATLFVLVPLQLWAIEKMFRSEGGRWIWLLGLASGGAFLSHHGHAVFALQLAAVYVLARWLLGGCQRSELWRILRVGFGVVGGLLLGSDLLWSIAREGVWTYPPTGFPRLHPDLSLDYIRRMVVWRNAWSGFIGAYVGATLLGFAVVGLSYALGRGRGNPISISVRAAIAMLMVAFVCAEHAGGRVGTWMLPPLCLLAGFGVAELARRKHGPGSLRLASGLTLLIVLDIGSTTIQSNFRTDRRIVTRDLETVAASIGSGRALLAYRNAAGDSEFNEFLEVAGNVPMFPLGAFPQGAPRSLNSQLAMVDQLNETPRTLDPLDLDLLFLWDVSTLLVVTRSSLVAPDIEGARPESVRSELGREIPFAAVPSSPVLFASEARVVEPSELTRLQESEMQLGPARRKGRPAYRKEMIHWVKEMGIARSEVRAGFLPLHPDSKVPERPLAQRRSGDASGVTEDKARRSETVSVTAAAELEAEGATPPAVVVSSCEVGQRSAVIEYEAREAGFLNLAFSWYPTLEVRLDGESAPGARGLLGGIVISTPAGSHVVELVPTRTPERTLVSWLGPLFGLAILAATALVARRAPVTH